MAKRLSNREQRRSDLPWRRVMKLHPLLQHAFVAEAPSGELVELTAVEIRGARPPVAADLDCDEVVRTFAQQEQIAAVLEEEMNVGLMQHVVIQVPELASRGL